MAELTLFEFLRTLPTPPGAVTNADLAKDTARLAEAIRADWELSILGDEQIGGHAKSDGHRNSGYRSYLRGSRRFGGLCSANSAWSSRN